MPELPEVETTVRGLRDKVVGKTITRFWCDHPNMIRYITPDKLAKLVTGARIIEVHRRGKNILIDLDNGKSLVAHMKMTGHFLYGKYQMVNGKWNAVGAGPLRDDPYNRFVHAIFTLSPTSLTRPTEQSFGRELRGARLCLAFSDMRKFGKIAIHDTKNLHVSKELEGLGPELWELKPAQFVEIFKNKRGGKIKQALLDQTILAGVGNIYSDEGLWVAGVHPLSKPNKIPNDKLLKLFKALVAVTKKSLETGGDSMSDYRNIDGLGGKFQNFHRAYRQTGKACKKQDCRGKIERALVGSRSTHYCKLHQRKYGN